MARSVASRGRPTSRVTSASSLILPFALTLTTAAIASAGLYFFSDSSSNSSSPSRPYLASDTEEERAPVQPRRSRKPPRTKAAILRQQDADLAGGFSDIPEEDTDAIVESRREEEERKRRRRRHLQMTGAGGMLARVKDAVGDALETVADEGSYDEEEVRKLDEQLEKQKKREEMAREQRREQQEIMSSRSKEVIEAALVPLPADTPTGERGAPPMTSSAEQYKPAPKRLKPIAIVVKERKATQGHDSDEEFEEALMPTPSLLSQLPHPLRLTNATLHILIHSPHLPSHPLTTPPSSTPKPQKSSSGGLSVVAPEPMPSPSLAPVRSLSDTSKSTYTLATELVTSLSLPYDHILPFTTPASIPSLLRTLTPAIVYFEEELLTREVAEEMLLRGGVQTIVLVVGSDGDDIAGLMSSDEETWGWRRGEGRWWEEGSEVRRRLGGRLQIVESWFLGDDWARRMEDLEDPQ